MNVNQIIEDDVRRVVDFIITYFDRMPPVSRVTYDALVPYVCNECGYPNPKLVRGFIHSVLNKRQDFFVKKGRGICKLA